MALFSGKTGSEKIANQIQRQLRPNDARTQAEDIHVVVLHTLVRRVTIVTQSGSNAGKFIGRYRGAYTAAANQHCALGLSIEDRAPGGLRIIGIVIGLGPIVRTAIDDFVPQTPQFGNHDLVQRNSGMVGSNGYFHGDSSRDEGPRRPLCM